MFTFQPDFWNKIEKETFRRILRIRRDARHRTWAIVEAQLLRQESYRLVLWSQSQLTARQSLSRRAGSVKTERNTNNITKFRLHGVTRAPRGDRRRTLPAGLTVVVQRQLARALQQRLQYSVGRRRQEPGDFLHSGSLHRFRNQQRKREIDSVDGRKSSAATKTKHTRQCVAVMTEVVRRTFSLRRGPGVSLIFMRSPDPIGSLVR